MKKWPIIVIVTFLLVALATSLMKKSGGDVCALDAIKIEPIYQVDITLGNQHVGSSTPSAPMKVLKDGPLPPSPIPGGEREIYMADGKTLKFCCIGCARKWLDGNRGKVEYITVTDEVTGKRIDASIAYFVESSIVTNQSTGNRIHVFAEKGDAEKHAKEFGGTIIKNPFVEP